MFPRFETSVLLLIAGLWWGAAIVLWVTWERWFASPGKRRAEERGSSQRRVWTSTLVDVIQFGLPSVLSIGLAVDGLVLGGIIFYAPGWSFFPPFSGILQLVAAFVLFLGLILLTAGAYLTGKYVYSRLPEERPLLRLGPYRYVRHPIYLSFLLTAAGLLFLAQNVVMLLILLGVLLFAVLAVRDLKPEEEELARRYGAEYQEYERRTGRFLPKFRRR